MAATSMASELLQNLDHFPYKVNIDDFGNHNHIDPEDLKHLRTNICDQFWVDTCPFQTRRGNIIPTGVYSIFGKYNNTPPETVKNELYDWVGDRCNEYTLLLGNVLNSKKWTFGTWSVNLKLRSKPADAGALYCINRMYHRHKIVYHKHGFWSTIASNQSHAETSKQCDIHLILLGDLKYGEKRPIQTTSDSSGTADWDKFEQWFQKASRDNQPHAPIAVNIRQNCNSTTPINYYDMNCGRVPAKTPRHWSPRGREPTTLSEPSVERLAAQKRIQNEKQRQKQKTSDISVIREIPPDVENVDDVVKMEIKTKIKKEDESRNTRHRYKGQALDLLNVHYIHKDGSICNKEWRMQRKELESQLPDLPNVITDTVSVQSQSGLSEETTGLCKTTDGITPDTSPPDNSTSPTDLHAGHSGLHDKQPIILMAQHQI